MLPAPTRCVQFKGWLKKQNRFWVLQNTRNHRVFMFFACIQYTQPMLSFLFLLFLVFFSPPLHVMGKILCFLPENSSARRPACRSYDLSHMSWLRGNRVILSPQLSHSNNATNTAFSGWLKPVSPRKKLKGRRPPWALSQQGLFNDCSGEICSQDLVESPPEARLA